MRALLRNIRPKCSLSGKISSCIGRKTPAESTRYIIGRLFSMAISCARRFFLAEIGNQAPAFTVASLETITQSLDLTYPNTAAQPALVQPPCSVYMPSPANMPISRYSRSGSNKYAILSHADSLPFSLSFLILSIPPPSFKFSLFWRSNASSSFIVYNSGLKSYMIKNFLFLDKFKIKF
ncbi:hypothetical protein D3C81_1072480 [compost metagenome]